MRIIISNIVTFNGGDFAILLSMIKELKQSFGEDTDIIVYDNNGDIADKYYPEINYRKLLYLNYLKRSTSKSSTLHKRIFKWRNAFTRKRFIVAARLNARGLGQIGRLLLSSEQKKDFNNYALADIIISSGGTYLVENYTLTSRYFDYDFTLALKKPLAFFTQSLGPFTKPDNKRLMKRIFDQAELILLRDQASFNYLKAIDVNISKARVCSDVVFSDADPTVLEKAKNCSSSNKALKVAISVRDWSFFKNQSAKEGMDKYNKSIAALCEYITSTLGGKVIFISTCQGITEYGKDDSKVALKIYELLSETAKSNTFVDNSFHHPYQLRDLIKDFDITISTRMHFAIQSLIMGVPALPVAYEFKTKELFSKLINKEYILDIDTIDADKLVEVFEKFITTLPGFRSELFENVERERQSALQPVRYLNEVFKEKIYSLIVSIMLYPFLLENFEIFPFSA